MVRSGNQHPLEAANTGIFVLTEGREAAQRIAEAYHWELLCPTQGRDSGDADR